MSPRECERRGERGPLFSSNTRPLRSIGDACLLGVLICALSSCLSRQDNFTQGRLEELCEASLPICKTRVTCTLDEPSFVTGTFPGAQSAVIYTPHPRSILTVRLLLDDQIYPGTELLVRAYQVGCADIEEERLLDVDLFTRAGDDRVIEFTFTLNHRGDHLIEWFSDATATYAVNANLTYKFGEE